MGSQFTISKILFTLLLTHSIVFGDSIFSDFQRDTPALWRYCLLRCLGSYETSQKTPFTMEGDTPIILVHGYLNSNIVWIDFRKALEQAKLGPVYAPTLHSSVKDIRRSAKEIARLVENVREQNGGKPVILIGHSMGGLVSSTCAQFYTPPGSIKAVITIGSPLRGTKLAPLGYGKAVHQMQCGSPFLKKLNAEIMDHPQATYFCLGSANDQVVRPYQNSFYKEPDGDSHFHLYTDIGHLSFLFHEDVINDLISMVHTLNDASSGNHP